MVTMVVVVVMAIVLMLNLRLLGFGEIGRGVDSVKVRLDLKVERESMNWNAGRLLYRRRWHLLVDHWSRPVDLRWRWPTVGLETGKQVGIVVSHSHVMVTRALRHGIVL